VRGQSSLDGGGPDEKRKKGKEKEGRRSRKNGSDGRIEARLARGMAGDRQVGRQARFLPANHITIYYFLLILLVFSFLFNVALF
jgi:hypothetical protein